MDTVINPAIIARRKRNTALAAAALLATLSLTAWAINRAVSPSVDASKVKPCNPDLNPYIQ